jgi:hypothetical protein
MMMLTFWGMAARSCCAKC